jgi:hypothetical protein
MVYDNIEFNKIPGPRQENMIDNQDRATTRQNRKAFSPYGLTTKPAACYTPGNMFR